jgi:sterol 3beta-glucosyltransferase
VRLAAPAVFARAVESRGVTFHALPGDPEALAQAFSDRAGASWLGMVRSMMDHVRPLACEALRVIRESAAGSDLIIHSFLMTDAGHTLARQQGITDISAQLFPVFLPTSAFPAVAMPDIPLGGGYRRFTHALNTGLFRHGARFLYGRMRRESPELPELAPWPWRKGEPDPTPILCAWSEALLPAPPDWPAWAEVTGCWTLPPDPSWQPSASLVRFLAQNPVPIYFGLGSYRSPALHGLIRSAISAARSCGKALLLGWPEEDIPADLQGSDVLSAAGVPHAWLFPRMGYILHHGGAGTTASAAAAGVPSSALPISVDQFFWARRIQTLGLGPTLPRAASITPELLASALREAFGNPIYRHAAQAVAGRMAAENGVDRAVEILAARLGGSS